MESYPESLLSHLQPTLFVAGLDDTALTTEDDNNDAALFATLRSNLRKVFLAKRAFSVWDPSRGTSAEFHVAAVDKAARFPPRKAKLPRDPAASGSTTAPVAYGPHSPISPLTPGSPLYPDGIIAPIWVKKHREMVPCVFVLVLKLWEHTIAVNDSANPLSPVDTVKPEQLEMERKKDAELVAEIIERKRQTAERGIKMAVILLASNQMIGEHTNTEPDQHRRG